MFISSFLVKKLSEMKKQKESRNYSLPSPPPPGERGSKTHRQDASLCFGEYRAGPGLLEQKPARAEKQQRDTPL